MVGVLLLLLADRLRLRHGSGSPGRNLLFTLMIGTLLLPYHVLIIPQYVLFQKMELINTFTPLLIGKYLATDAFFVFLMVQFMRSLPKELDEAARLDGCGHLRIYWSHRAAAVPAGADHQRDLHVHQRPGTTSWARCSTSTSRTSTPSRWA